MARNHVLYVATSAIAAAAIVHTQPAEASGQFYACVQFTNNSGKDVTLDSNALNGVYTSTVDCPSSFGGGAPSGTVTTGQTVIWETGSNGGFSDTGGTTVVHFTPSDSGTDLDYNSPWTFWNGFGGGCTSNHGLNIVGGAVSSGDNTCMNEFATTGSQLALIKLAGGVRGGDFDGDRAADIAMWRPSDGSWNVMDSSGGTTNTAWGTNGDIPVMGDYDGNKKADLAVWRPSNGTWYINYNPAVGATGSVQWGQSGDIPVVGDYNGDGDADFAVWRPSNGTWYINYKPSLGVTGSLQWGNSGDVPVPGDYDGDGKTDFATWRANSNGLWSIQLAAGGTQSYNYGASGDLPVPGDYDGDGKTDVAVWRPSSGVWYISYASGGSSTPRFGNAGDIPVPADYDGDGKIDIAVWRPSNLTWYISYSTGGQRTQKWGMSGDVPPINAAEN